MTTTASTAHQDRWELIADRMWKIPELGWAIAESNPDLAGYLVLPAGLALVIPELRSLRRPLTAANPAREDNGEFIQLPPPPPSPVPPSGGGGGSVVFPIKILQGGTDAGTAQQALLNLGAVALASKGVPGGIAGLDGGAIVPFANLPPYPTLDSLGAIPVSQKGAVNGIAPLDSNSLVPVANLPPYPTLNSLNGVSINSFNTAINSLVPITAIGAINGVAPLNSAGTVPFSFLPPYPTLASLGALAASSRGAANGVAPLDVQSQLPAGNLPATIPVENLPLNTAFPFTAGASFRGGASPANNLDLVQAGVDANGLPRYWLVNASAPANSRIKSITVANNGNVQIRHHNDDLSDGNVLEHTASGNVLTNGTLRPGGGTTNFTGATFVPGALFYRSDLGMLVYSDGTNWRRMDTNATV